jgi:cbb3-type cytochrome oxidase maturation protein
LDIDILIYLAGSFLMMGICIGFVAWGFKSRQFKENEYLRHKPLEEDDEDQ